jgi:hypothetical protein
MNLVVSTCMIFVFIIEYDFIIEYVIVDVRVSLFAAE